MPSSKPKGRTIEMEVRIRAPREAVWSALTEPFQLAQWFPPVAGGKPGLGEELTFSWGPELQWRTRVVAWEPGRHLLWRGEGGTPPAPSWGGTTRPPTPPYPPKGPRLLPHPRPSPWRWTGRWRRPVGMCW